MKNEVQNCGRVIIAGTGSGSGKTTITAALLRLMAKKGISAAPFKCGPDYIDPSILAMAAGKSCGTLDSFIMGWDGVKRAFEKREKGIAVLEGVMGYYDGLKGSDRASAYEISNILSAPVILTVNCKGMGASLGAVIRGFKNYRENSNIKGVIFNNASSGMYEFYGELAKREGVLPLGYMPELKGLSIPSRHLGLFMAEDTENIEDILNTLADMAENTLDLDGIIKTANNAEAANGIEHGFSEFAKQAAGSRAVVAVARDKAFSFIYRDNIWLLEELGAEIIYFSPLEDEALPENADAVIFYGGYPELYMKELSENESMKRSVRAAFKNGMPVIAECGGYIYMHEGIQDADGNVYELCGLTEGTVYDNKRLCDFGYWEMTAEYDNLLLKKGEKINIHEFHYWKSDKTAAACVLKKPGADRHRTAVEAGETYFFGFPHIHFYANTDMAERFLNKAEEYGKNAGGKNRYYE